MPTRTTDVTSATLSLGVRDERTELTVKQALRAAPLQQPKTAEDVLTVMGEVPATYHASLTGSHSTRLAPVCCPSWRTNGKSLQARAGFFGFSCAPRWDSNTFLPGRTGTTIGPLPHVFLSCSSPCQKQREKTEPDFRATKSSEQPCCSGTSLIVEKSPS